MKYPFAVPVISTPFPLQVVAVGLIKKPLTLIAAC
jgi:hypothetical protein